MNYYRTDGVYKDWDLWVWAIGANGSGVKLNREMVGEKIVFIDQIYCYGIIYNHVGGNVNVSRLLRPTVAAFTRYNAYNSVGIIGRYAFENVGKRVATLVLDSDSELDFSKTYIICDEPADGFDMEINFSQNTINKYKLYDNAEFAQKFHYDGALGANVLYTVPLVSLIFITELAVII